jgi:hypothetical protein
VAVAGNNRASSQKAGSGRDAQTTATNASLHQALRTGHGAQSTLVCRLQGAVPRRRWHRRLSVDGNRRAQSLCLVLPSDDQPTQRRSPRSVRRSSRSNAPSTAGAKSSTKSALTRRSTGGSRQASTRRQTGCSRRSLATGIRSTASASSSISTATYAGRGAAFASRQPSAINSWTFALHSSVDDGSSASDRLYLEPSTSAVANELSTSRRVRRALNVFRAERMSCVRIRNDVVSCTPC